MSNSSYCVAKTAKRTIIHIDLGFCPQEDSCQKAELVIMIAAIFLKCVYRQEIMTAAIFLKCVYRQEIMTAATILALCIVVL
jgi:hypothetical protein